MSNFLFRNRDKAVFVLFLGIPVFSTYLLFSRKPIWMDEVLTIVNATSGGFWEVVQGIYYGGTETHPPFYFLLARAISLFTDNLFGALRYFSAICLGLAWFVSWKIMESIKLPSLLSVSAGVLLFSSEPVLMTGAEARTYTFFLLLISLLIYVHVQYFLGLYSPRKYLYFSNFLAIAALFTHYFAILYLPLICAANMVHLLLVQRKVRWEVVLFIVIPYLIFFLLWYPALQIHLSFAKPHTWIPRPTPLKLMMTFFMSNIYLYGLFVLWHKYTIYLCISLILLLIFRSSIRKKFKWRVFSAHFYAFCLSFFFFLLVPIVWIYSQYFSPLFVWRYFFNTLLAWFIFIAIFFSLALFVILEGLQEFWISLNRLSFYSKTYYKKFLKLFRTIHIKRIVKKGSRLWNLSFVNSISLIMQFIILALSVLALTVTLYKLATKSPRKQIDIHRVLGLTDSVPVIAESPHVFLPVWFVFGEPYKFALDWEAANTVGNKKNSTVDFKLMLAQRKYNKNNSILYTKEILTKYKEFYVIDEEKRKWFEVRIKNNPMFVYKVINKDLDSLTKLSYPREPIRLLFVERKAK